MFIDTHCHLDAIEFGDTQASLLQAARQAGVQRFVLPSVAATNFAAVRELCLTYPDCLPAYGIHPFMVARATAADLSLLREYLQQHAPVAVGEIGLDFLIENYHQPQQEYFFNEQLKLAQEFNLPVLLHGRRAADTLLKYLRRYKLRGGIAHAFSGSRQQADEFIKLGFKLGFGGAMTYPRATRLRELAASLPLSSIVLETDAPDMPPVFLSRGEPNKPQYLPKIAETLATLRGQSLAEIAQITSQNALAVLSL